MFVSILQLMGFPVRAATVLAAPEKPETKHALPDNQGINRLHAGAPPKKGRLADIASAAAGADEARRLDLKAQPKVAAKARKPAAKAKPAVKAAAKAPAKKAAAKPATKAAAKAVAKPAAKAAAKVPAKPLPAKAPAKVPAPAVAKAKVPAKAAAPAVPPAKAEPAKPVTRTTPAPAKAAAPAAKPAAGKQPSPQPAAAVSPGKPAASATLAPARPAPAPVPPAPASTPAVPAAAKASYIPMATNSVLTPPPVVAVKKDPKLANNWKTKSAEELTDAEVLAMPDSEYMNDKQMAFFRVKLQQLKTDILNSAGETTEHLREDTVIVPDPADRATIEEEHALELRTRDRERKLLKKIEQSIARIDAGDYGYCDETGEPIGVGRLLARPTATLSLEAQQRRELKQKMFGD
jgi:DnaK suppressor protein